MRLIKLLLAGGVTGCVGIIYQMVEGSRAKKEISWPEVKNLAGSESLLAGNVNVTAESFNNVEEWTFKAGDEFSAPSSGAVEYLIGGPSIKQIKNLDQHSAGCVNGSGISQELSRAIGSRRRKGTRGCGGTLWKIIKGGGEEVGSIEDYQERENFNQDNVRKGIQEELNGPVWIVRDLGLKAQPK